MTLPSPPMSLLAELTHRCPLSCPYCSNPLELERKTAELDTAGWRSVLEQAADLGVLQVHFSGGEPMSRPDLVELVSVAQKLNLYSNLITSGVLLDEPQLEALDKAGLDHIQLSFQDVTEDGAERIGGLKGAQARKIRAARLIRASGIPMTLNFVVHRENVARIPQMFALARDLGAARVEIAHTQYYGWGLKNRGALLPSREQLEASTRAVEEERAKGGLSIDYVTPDYHADRPKPCMGGWGQRFVNVTPSGRVLPCHAAEIIPDVDFPNVKNATLSEIWNASPLFNMFRGTDWMPEPCRSCERKERDWGGCRCQALALTGKAENTDPVCELSPFHGQVKQAVEESSSKGEELVYRRYR
ncbi:pyrroloquinoline quinone biosynthesis protein PqqE [Gluconobacter kanchanaburiensis]|uniref:PqqA peptide cyclase n=1 Tax=Gluconobacter kanchanaburiensis NBRC 103587 TaxID=1307948 RepID=A0A511B5F1_9PROT|nr:pyrroloquinoline quinone biosynthesis protein PqqE [Gluconobacter kanchanaburiensis]MBF0861880.1 pyrroloquinoline quinone biosynthesis protein PqqE [Gluconobacter kanchanaburiensis]GBR67878.1 pyrroloquinoline quinone biosynthesis protein PqqE [Gluconobacter kanchanaburiensis NBRC 103587]GEK95594.1 coenzyme PQQ synthesis protein E [Gluconobacter kanchanaburiensis NBRC 103587]